jgi:hypothetical protein
VIEFYIINVDEFIIDIFIFFVKINKFEWAAKEESINFS